MAWNPTPQQIDAITERSRTLLVSAAAGSGKTAVLTNRIIQSLMDGVKISDMLIVTFTRAAAGEMRSRIAKKLTEELAEHPDDRNLKEQLMLLNSARISTIDSFYYDLVRSHFQAANMPPTFRMAEDAELLPLRREAMNTAVDEMYEADEGFTEISDIFCNFRDETRLTTQMIDLYERLYKYPQGIEILLHSAKELREHADSPLSTAFGQTWIKEIEAWATAGQEMYQKGLELLSHETESKSTVRLHTAYTERLERCNAVLDAIGDADYTAVCNAVATPFSSTFQYISYTKFSEDLKDLQQSIGLFNTKWKEDLTELTATPENAVYETALRTARTLEVLYELLRRYDEKYTEAKRTREVAEFSDVSRAAYRLLVAPDDTPTPLARELSKSFKAIYIDEYQDVDAMQDATFRAISTPTNRFMVGDIKQSIYRFRGAQPNVFAGYKEKLPALEETASNTEAASIFMSDCFRCDENVIKFANAVSGYLFSHNAKSISYTTLDDLHFKKPLPKRKIGDEEVEVKDYKSPLCRVLFVQKPKKKKGEKEDEEDTPDSHAEEANLVANEIQKLIGKQEKANGELICAGDIAVLMRSTTIAKPLSDALAALGIRVSDTSKQSFFENPEVLCMYSLLATIDNPMRDVYLAAALRSPFFGFTLQDLVALRTGADSALSLYQAICNADQSGISDTVLAAKVGDFLTRLRTYREKAQELSVDKLLRYLYRETGVMAFAGFEEDEGSGTVARRGNLRRLYEYARTFEMGGFKGLHQFVRYVDTVMENDTKMPSPEGDGDAVSLITIHHSKGLEFPVCFVVGTGTKFNNDDIKPPLLCDELLGCATQLCNAGPFSRTDTFFRQTLALEITRQNREEEMRVLYVAMTRAEEFLYITGASCDSIQNMRNAARKASHPDTPFLATRSSSYMKWILAALERIDHSEFCTLEILDATAQSDTEVPPPAQPEVLEPEAIDTPDTHETDTVVGDMGQQLPNADEKTIAFLKHRFDFTYPHGHLTRLPAKLSVSNLSASALDVFCDVAPNDAKDENALAQEKEKLLRTFERRPEFGQKPISAAEKGTATHEFLQFCDFDRVRRHGVHAELAYLIEQRFLSPDTEKAVRTYELKRFFESEFFKSLARVADKHPQNIHRETRFHISLPARDFTQNKQFAEQLGDAQLAVQGVIDLFYTDEEGNLILCDYKTDRLTPQELQNPALATERLTRDHRSQLMYYAQALEGICDKRPDKVLIFSLHLGEAVEINLNA